MRILLLRHGETPGNREKRYVGTTDEGLTAECKERLREAAADGGPGFFDGLGPVTEIFTSPLRRCLETAELVFPKRLFPEAGRSAVPGLSECDFGRFEYKNYRELSGDPDYQRFLDSGGTAGFPGGEDVGAFKKRCVSSFEEIVNSRLGAGDRTLVFVVHGGAIMAVMEVFGHPRGDYFSWQTGCLSGYLCEAEKEKGGFRLAVVAKIRVL